MEKGKQKVAFTATLDDKYMQGFLVTFSSMLRSSKNFNYDVIIFEWGQLSDKNKAVIKSLYDKVIFKMVDIKLYESHNFDDTYRKWTYNCNYRFDIFALEEYDRVVFFDADMIFQIDVDEVLAYDIDFGACPLGKGVVSQIGDRIGFDAGFMTIGKKYLSKQVRQELIDIANSPPPVENHFNTQSWFGNEPILNTYFLDKMVWLPIRFDLVVSETMLEHLKVKNNFQFTGHNKPWYGTSYEEQFSAYALKKITTNNGKLLSRIIFQKIIFAYQSEVEALKEKGINIFDFTSTLKPIYEVEDLEDLDHLTDDWLYK